VLVDTTFWIDLLEERQAGVRGPAHVFMARHRAHTLCISIITWGELAESFPTSEGLNFFLRKVKVLMLPLQVAWAGGRLQSHLGSVAQRLGENDAWIAAMALTWGKRLVTRDRDFRRVPRLRITGY
jgi:predicted nucleic acid-binding protein